MATPYAGANYGPAGYQGAGYTGINPLAAQNSENMKNILRWIALALLGLLILGALIYLFRYLTGSRATAVGDTGSQAYVKPAYSNLRHHVLKQ